MSGHKKSSNDRYSRKTCDRHLQTWMTNIFFFKMLSLSSLTVLKPKVDFYCFAMCKPCFYLQKKLKLPSSFAFSKFDPIYYITLKKIQRICQIQRSAVKWSTTSFALIAFCCLQYISFFFIELHIKYRRPFGENPGSSGLRRGLTVWAMVLGRDFDSWFCLKTRWIRQTTWWQKRMKIIKTAKRGKSLQKKYKKNFKGLCYFLVLVGVATLNTFLYLPWSEF